MGGVTRMSVFCGLAALLVLSGSHLSHAASVLKPKECDGIKTPLEYVERLEAIFDGDERGASVCEDTLFGRTDQFWEGNELPESLSKNSLMWVFVSDSSVLNKFLDFASQECSGVDSQCDREALIVKMMNYAGDLDTLTLWTRAYFEMCMGINEWFTGLGLGYDPTNHKTTGNEWYVRGDKAVPSKDLDAAYVTLWSK